MAGRVSCSSGLGKTHQRPSRGRVPEARVPIPLASGGHMTGQEPTTPTRTEAEAQVLLKASDGAFAIIGGVHPPSQRSRRTSPPSPQGGVGRLFRRGGYPSVS